ncbi:class I SAM-dependent methyltransferase [Alsobacter sp. KACC 23698]|uniref:Class I SAM-dependent methyltransferase n=1 Tax=Alsobacter sp. KACC 23698 TaxID=3149229 RepID=A0AAU7JJD3_9HYPH
MDRVERESARARRAYSDLSARFANLTAAMRDGGAENETAKPAPDAQDAALSPLLSRFYATFEDRFRGSREEVRDRVAALLPEVRETLDRLGGGRVVDLGCGRGEWLEVVQQAGYDVLGVDNNEAQLGSARERGLPVLRADALEWLCAQPDGSIAVATAFHLVEHLPFPVLVRFCLEMQRVLAPGGSLLFETPNPENVLVGAWSFHLDPTHQKPLPPELLECLLDTVGFEAVRVRMLHPHPWRQGFLSKGGLPPEVVELLFGPLDYAVVASKPR